jgi:hypothetical protein
MGNGARCGNRRDTVVSMRFLFAGDLLGRRTIPPIRNIARCGFWRRRASQVLEQCEPRIPQHAATVERLRLDIIATGGQALDCRLSSIFRHEPRSPFPSVNLKRHAHRCGEGGQFNLWLNQRLSPAPSLKHLIARKVGTSLGRTTQNKMDWGSRRFPAKAERAFWPSHVRDRKCKRGR